MDKQTDRQRNRKTKKKIDGQMNMWTIKALNLQMGRQTETQIGGQTEIERTEKQTDRHGWI